MFSFLRLWKYDIAQGLLCFIGAWAHFPRWQMLLSHNIRTRAPIWPCLLCGEPWYVALRLFTRCCCCVAAAVATERGFWEGLQLLNHHHKRERKKRERERERRKSLSDEKMCGVYYHHWSLRMYGMRRRRMLLSHTLTFHVVYPEYAVWGQGTTLSCFPTYTQKTKYDDNKSCLCIAPVFGLRPCSSKSKMDSLFGGWGRACQHGPHIIVVGCF